MRGAVILIVMVGLLGVLDAFAFGGRYRQAVGQEARSQGHNFSYQMQRWIRSAGLR